jgi:hypothetical protein
VTHWPVLMLVFFGVTHLGLRDATVLTVLLIVASLAVGTGYVWLRKNLKAGIWLFQFPPLEPGMLERRPDPRSTT